MAKTADSLFKVVTYRGQDYTVTYGGKVIDGEGTILDKGRHGNTVTRVLKKADWTEDALDLQDYEGEDKQEAGKTSYSSIIKGVVKFFKDDFIPTKKRDATPGLYLERGYDIWELTADGKWFRHGLNGSREEVTGDHAKAIKFTVEYEDSMEPIEFGSPEFFEALDRKAYTTPEQIRKLWLNYSGPKAAEEFVEFLGDLVTNVGELPVELVRAILSKDSDELGWDRRTQLTFTSKHGRQLAEAMLDKGNPNLDALLKLITALPLELLTEAYIIRLINKAGRATDVGNKAVEALDAEGDNVDWEKFFEDPDGYIESLGKYVETPEVPKDTLKVTSKALNRLKGQTSLSSTLKVKVNPLQKKVPLQFPAELPKLTTKQLKKLSPVIPENTVKVQVNPLQTFVRKIPETTVRVKTRPKVRRKPKYSEYALMVRTRRLERVKKDIPKDVPRLTNIKPLGRRDFIEIKPGVFRAETRPLPRLLQKVLDVTLPRVKVRKLERTINRIADTVDRVIISVLHPIRTINRIRNRSTVSVKTRVIRRLKHSILGDLHSSLRRVKTNKLTRRQKLTVNASVVRAITRPLVRSTLAIPRAVLRIPLKLIRVVHRLTTNPLISVATFIPKALFRILRRRSKTIRAIDVKLKLAKRKFRVLKRRAVKVIPGTVLRVVIRTLPRLRHIPKPELVAAPLTTTPIETGVKGVDVRTPVYGNVSRGAPARAVGKLKGNVLSGGAGITGPSQKYKGIFKQ